MRFLRKDKDRSKDDSSNRLEVMRIMRITVQCDVCEYWGKMEGGVLKEDQGYAAFLCPSCGSVKRMKWVIG